MTGAGLFAGFGEGSLVGSFGGRDLFITYAGGDGNDLSLLTGTAIPESSGMALAAVAVAGCLFRRNPRVERG